MEKVIIGISTRNRKELLLKAIESAICQTYKNKEIIVFDDNSNDGTCNLIEIFPEVTWYRSNKTLGYLHARKLFLDHQEATYYCSLDDDAWFLNDKVLELTVDFLNNNRNTAAIAFDIQTPDEKYENDITSISLLRVDHFIGCGHILRISAAKQVGGYITTPGYYGCEEKDICIRLYDAGYDVIKFKGLFIWHEKTILSRDLPRQHRAGVCNDLVFTFRRLPFMLLFPVLIYKIFRHCIFSVFQAGQNLFIPFAKGVFDFFIFLQSGNIKRSAVSLDSYRNFINLGRRPVFISEFPFDKIE